MESYSCWLSDFRIVINELPQTEYEENLYRQNNTVVIPNAIPLNKFHQDHPPIPSSETFTVLMVARIDPRKDHATLLQALGLLQNELPQGFKLILIGETTDPATQKQIDTLINHHKLQSLITQEKPTHNIEPYYHHADITILTSTSEGFPNVILESFAASKPIIVSDTANFAGIVTHNVNGWVFPASNSEALAVTLRTAWQTSPTRRAQMGTLGHAEVTNYSIRTMVERYAQLYQRAMSRP
jgi:glycosyltransferase involved in cell wall biosynthesis